jgi:Concanavalin A-like lectin/glucanases superfamily
VARAPGGCRVQRPVLILATAALLAGCSVDVSLVGKACSNEGTCPAPLVCDSSSQTCQSSSNPTVATAADWSASMFALYRFEPGELTKSSAPVERPLVERNAPQPIGDAIEGAGAVGLDAAQQAGLDGLDPAFAFETDFTVGGWWWAGETTSNSPNALQRRLPDAGYMIERNTAASSATCVFTSAMGTGVGEGPPGAWPLGTWTHVVCRYRRVGAEARIDTFVDGVSGEEGTALWENAPAETPLEIGGDSFTGRVDELFFAEGLLSSQAIARIRACGVNGAACECGGAGAYLQCGRAGDCTPLPPCDQATP